MPAWGELHSETAGTPETVIDQVAVRIKPFTAEIDGHWLC